MALYCNCAYNFPSSFAVQYLIQPKVGKHDGENSINLSNTVFNVTYGILDWLLSAI